MRERFERAKPGQIEVAEKARRVLRIGLDQSHIEIFRAGSQILRNRRTAGAATDHYDARLGLAPRRSPAEPCRERGRGCRVSQFATRPASHGR
jgi:hypothetical protein